MPGCRRERDGTFAVQETCDGARLQRWDSPVARIQGNPESSPLPLDEPSVVARGEAVMLGTGVDRLGRELAQGEDVNSGQCFLLGRSLPAPWCRCDWCLVAQCWCCIYPRCVCLEWDTSPFPAKQKPKCRPPIANDRQAHDPVSQLSNPRRGLEGGRRKRRLETPLCSLPLSRFPRQPHSRSHAHPQTYLSTHAA